VSGAESNSRPGKMWETHLNLTGEEGMFSALRRFRKGMLPPVISEICSLSYAKHIVTESIINLPLIWGGTG